MVLPSPRGCPRAAPVALLAGALLVAVASTASADIEAEEGESERAGTFMVNVKLGPSVGLVGLPTQLALQVELGVALTPDRRGYLVLPVQLQTVHDPSALLIPLGFQYDFALPFRSLYLYPRVSVGYAALLGEAGGIAHMGVAIAELGLKYVPTRRFAFGLEPVSLPLLFDGSRVLLSYRILAYAGVLF